MWVALVFKGDPGEERERELTDGWFWRCLTFELSGRRRQDAGPGLAKMYRVPPDRAWWPAVGAPLERGVRHQGFGALAAAGRSFASSST